jgi:hypothetical protein
MSEPNDSNAAPSGGVGHTTPKEFSEWARLRSELRRRIREPAGRVAFVLYFLTVVFVLGGMGWLIPLCRFYVLKDESAFSEVPSAASAFFLALLAGGLADIVLGEDSGSDNSPTPAASKGFKMFALGFSLLSVPLAVVGIQRSHLFLAHAASAAGLALGLFLWWVLNADRARWQDEVPEAIAATGGPTTVELKGTTEGLIT